jgi:hypothetical protein
VVKSSIEEIHKEKLNKQKLLDGGESIKMEKVADEENGDKRDVSDIQ